MARWRDGAASRITIRVSQARSGSGIEDVRATDIETHFAPSARPKIALSAKDAAPALQLFWRVGGPLIYLPFP
jgi:hypothetical protein